MSVGERRTAEELGRAFPGVPVRTSGRDPGGAGVLDTVDAPARAGRRHARAPSRAPRAGYAAALLLDGRLMLDRPDLRAAEESRAPLDRGREPGAPGRRGRRRGAARRPGARPGAGGGPPRPGGLRRCASWPSARPLRLPPAWRVAELVGRPADVDDLLAHARLPEGATVLGPGAGRGPVRGAVGRGDGPTTPSRGCAPSSSVPRADGLALAAALHAAAGVRSARKEGAAGHRARRPGRPGLRPASVARGSAHGGGVPRLGAPARRPQERPRGRQAHPPVRRPGAHHPGGARSTTFDKELRKLVKDLTDTMLDAPGAGLAAPQLGVSLRVFTYDVDDEIGHLINPVLDLSDEMQEGDEGCLSVPDLAFNTRARCASSPRA